MAITTPLLKAFECRRCFVEFSSNTKLYQYIRETYGKKTPTSVTKSIAPYKYIATLKTSPSSSPLSEYRAVSPPSPIYENITTSVTPPPPKTYLTVTDLYMRYAPLKSVKTLWIRLMNTRFRTILFTLIVQDLYDKFHEKPINFTYSKTSNSLINKNSLLLKSHSIIAGNSNIKTSFFSISKSIAQRPTTQ